MISTEDQLINPVGSSETTRESPLSNGFNFDDYFKNYKPQHKQINNKNLNQDDYLGKIRSEQRFYEWLIGFIEGGGYFGFRNNEGPKRLTFAIGQSDLPLLRRLRNELGFGTIRSDFSKAESFRYVVEDRSGIKRIMAILNGNLVLPKRRAQFVKWVNAGNRFLDPNFRLTYRVPKVSSETGWISGFIEAEGCFHATLTKPSQPSKITKRLSQKITITQQDTMGESQVLLDIGNLFGWSGNLSPAKKSTNCYKLEMGSIAQHMQIRNYILNFPLKGKKNIAFKRWCRVFELRIKKDHLVEANLPKVKQLCREINKQNKEQIENKARGKDVFDDRVTIIE